MADSRHEEASVDSQCAWDMNRKMGRWSLRPFGLGSALVIVAAASTNVAGADPETTTPADFKVAFIADQGLRPHSIAVLQLIEDEGTDMVLHQGDFDYEVGWGPYEECREGGAIVATGHEHSYSRTHLMDNFETQIIASTSNTLQIEKCNLSPSSRVSVARAPEFRTPHLPLILGGRRYTQPPKALIPGRCFVYSAKTVLETGPTVISKI